MHQGKPSASGGNDAAVRLAQVKGKFDYGISKIVELHKVAVISLSDKKVESVKWGKVAETQTDETAKALLSLTAEVGEQDYGYILPSVLRGSLLMSVCGLFDRYLGKICQICAEARGSVKVSENKPRKAFKNGIWKKIEFLGDGVGSILRERHELSLQLLTQVRNSFAHASGLVDAKEARKLCDLCARLKAGDEGEQRLGGFTLSKVGFYTLEIELDQWFLCGVFTETPKVFAAILQDVEVKLTRKAT